MTNVLARWWAGAQREARWWHGIQLGLAVLVAYGASVALGLPESLWSVMSALIVVRPTAGASLGASGHRLTGTLAGCLFGIAGAWLHHHGAGTALATAGIVAALAFASAAVPLLGSAPMAALIVMSGGGIPGHSALQVALLRGMEVGLGVIAGMGVALLLQAARATSRFGAECAQVLDELARQLVAPAQAEADVRGQLRQLVMLAMQADRERRLLHRPRLTGDAAVAHTRLARLLMRTAQSSSVLGRTLGMDEVTGLREEVAACAALAVREVAACLRGEEGLGSLAALGKMRDRLLAGEGRDQALLSCPVSLLHDDLRTVVGLSRKLSTA